MFFSTCVEFWVTCFSGWSSKVSYSRHMDLLKGIGLVAALAACRRLIKGATLWLGCPCSQWVWISRGSTRRNRLRPSGSKRIASVKAANRLVRRLCYLWLVCTCKGTRVFFLPLTLKIFESKLCLNHLFKIPFPKNSRVIQWQLIPCSIGKTRCMQVSDIFWIAAEDGICPKKGGSLVFGATSKFTAPIVQTVGGWLFEQVTIQNSLAVPKFKNLPSSTAAAGIDSSTQSKILFPTNGYERWSNGEARRMLFGVCYLFNHSQLQ